MSGLPTRRHARHPAGLPHVAGGLRRPRFRCARSCALRSRGGRGLCRGRPGALQPSASRDGRRRRRGVLPPLGRAAAASRSQSGLLTSGAWRANERRTIEDAGRLARYAFLERTRGQLAADRVAVGHTRDDQAETYLLKLCSRRGSSRVVRHSLSAVSSFGRCSTAPGRSARVSDGARADIPARCIE